MVYLRQLVVRVKNGLLLVALLCLPVAVLAVDKGSEQTKPEPLPNPLSLKQAIELSGENHPDLEIATSHLDQSQAHFRQTRAEKGFDLSLNAYGQAVDPANGMPGPVGDSMATLLLTKPLYDFGKTGNRIASAKAQLESEWSRYFSARQQRRLDIMSLFFNVLLADLRYRVDDETMARTYVTYDRIRQRHKLGQVSDVTLLEYESRYRSALSKRVASDAQRRATRARLAIGMNRPDDLADNLTPPILDDLDRKVPEYDKELAKVLKANPVLIATRYDVEAAERALRSAKAYSRPKLDLELEASQYERPIGLRNDARAGVVMKWSIYQGGLNRAKVVEADANLREKRALLTKTENTLRQKTLELLQKIDELQYQRKASKVLVDYRDLKLDQSRALYEMEARATLGDAMIGVTDAQWRAARVNYQLALAWAQLKALSGELVEKTAKEKYR
jgi:outer membrane protein TolC